MSVSLLSAEYVVIIRAQVDAGSCFLRTVLPRQILPQHEMDAFDFGSPQVLHKWMRVELAACVPALG